MLSAASRLPRLDRKIVFVGGKGGVGKTTIAAAVGVRAADSGHRCLLVSTDPAHSLGHLFDRRIGDPEQRILPRLWGLELDPETETDRYLKRVGRTMREMVHPEMYHEIDRHLELVRLAPGSMEAAMLERMAELMIRGGDDYDRVVFDTAPTGHTLRLLSLPEIMGAWVDGLLKQRDRSAVLEKAQRQAEKGGDPDDLSMIDEAEPGEDPRSRRIREVLGERQRKFHQARDLLRDAGQTGFLFVVVPERLPIQETANAIDNLRGRNVDIVGVVVNKVLPGGSGDTFLQQRREQQARYLGQIDTLFSELTRVRVPLLPFDVGDPDSLRQIASRLWGDDPDSP